MATKTLGTTATTTLTAIAYLQGGSGIAAADAATIRSYIKDDQTNGAPVWQGGFDVSGLLYVPNRGVLKILPGDWIGVDTVTGWPILVSKLAAASNPSWVHS
jgi:hypothetical protein